MVIECNEIVIRTYQFIKLYCLYCYKEGIELPDLTNDRIILAFIKAIGVKSNRGYKPKNQGFYNIIYKNNIDVLFNNC